MILVTVAVAYECGGWRERLPEGFELLVTGVGRAKAREALENWFQRNGVPELLISTGFAGGLRPGLRAGDLFLATNRTDASWSERLTGREWRRGALYTAENILRTRAEKQRFRQALGVDAVDMETEAICRVCEERGVPVISLRAISDDADAELSFPLRILSAAGDHPVSGGLRLLGYLATHPGRIAGFRGLVSDSTKARKSLENGMGEMVRLIASSR